MVLIGDGRDGSYVLPDDLKGIKFCFSPGVGPTSQFETEIFDIYGIHSYLIDASVNSVPGERNDFYKFERKFLGATSYNEFISLDDWVNENDAMFEKNDLLLQMDIEGHEFVSLLAADDQTLCRFRIIAMEIHFLDLLNLDLFSSIFEQFVRKLDKYFVVCYARPNDCCGFVSVGPKKLPRVMELTLIRRDRIKSIQRTYS